MPGRSLILYFRTGLQMKEPCRPITKQLQFVCFTPIGPLSISDLPNCCMLTQPLSNQFSEGSARSWWIYWTMIKSLPVISSTAPPENLFLVWTIMQAQGWGQHLGCPCPQFLVIFFFFFQVLVLEAETALPEVSLSSPFTQPEHQTIKTPGEDHDEAPILADSLPSLSYLTTGFLSRVSFSTFRLFNNSKFKPYKSFKVNCVG